MREISEPDIQARISRDNPWWKGGLLVEHNLPRRVYFGHFKKLALMYGVKRAAILLGPRRVGKTVMLKQVIQEAVNEGLPSRNVLYASIDTPLYSGLSLATFLRFLPGAEQGEQCLVVFDEIQYLKDWETHLKDLVDSYPNIKFVASGSAAAALKLKSRESGAGRFSDFMLPPLTFCEFIEFTEKADILTIEGKEIRVNDIEALNRAFLDYLNFGGYPEAVLNPAIRDNPDQFIRNDIIDKVLLKDLPSLYGIHDIQGLNKLFMYLAYNSGNEATLEGISQASGMNKQTIKRYIEYLESAFLVIKLSTVDDTCRSLQRERHFKIYLSNPSMRAALFAPVEESDYTTIGLLAESAVFSQWQHSTSFRQLRYARWRNEGEVDVVYLGEREKPTWIGEVKWSDRLATDVYGETKAMQTLLNRHPSIVSAFATSRTKTWTGNLCGRSVTVRPTALYCYIVGRNITSNLRHLTLPDGDNYDDLDEFENFDDKTDIE